MAVAHVGVAPGSGVVGRYGATVVLVADAGADDPFTTGLLAALEAVDPTRIAWQLLPVLQEQSAPFAVATELRDGWQLLLHGDVHARVEGADGTLELSGADAVTWVDRRLPGPVSRLSLALSPGEVRPDARSSLQGGLVPGEGLVVTTGTTTAPAPLDPGPAHEDEPGAPPPAAAPARRQTLDLGEPPAPVDRSPAQTAVVRLDSVGALVADDGSRTLLDRAYALGREPSQSEAVRRGDATPVVVNDPDNLISRVHVLLSVEEGAVLLSDGGSANGTFIAAPGAEGWDRIGSEPTALPPGWSMRIGRRVFTHVTAATSD